MGGNAASIQRRVNGLSKNIAGCAPATALFFLAYEPSKRYLERTLPPEQITWLCLMQVDGVFEPRLGECRRKSSRRERKPAIKCKLRNLRASGIAGLFVGYGSFNSRLTGPATEFSLYEEATDFSAMQDEPGRSQSRGGECKRCGSGGMTGFVTTPLDVIKTS